MLIARGEQPEDGSDEAYALYVLGLLDSDGGAWGIPHTWKLSLDGMVTVRKIRERGEVAT